MDLVSARPDATAVHRLLLHCLSHLSSQQHLPPELTIFAVENGKAMSVRASRRVYRSTSRHRVNPKYRLDYDERLGLTIGGWPSTREVLASLMTLSVVPLATNKLEWLQFHCDNIEIDL